MGLSIITVYVNRSRWSLSKVCPKKVGFRIVYIGSKMHSVVTGDLNRSYSFFVHNKKKYVFKNKLVDTKSLKSN